MAKKQKGKDVAIAGLTTAFEKFDAAASRAVTVSERNIGKIHTGRQRRALMVFSKMIVHNLSIRSSPAWRKSRRGARSAASVRGGEGGGDLRREGGKDQQEKSHT